NAERRGYLHGINDETVARLLHKQALPFKHVTDFVTVAEYRDYHQREELWEKQLATFVVGVRILQEGFGWQGEERIPMMTSLDRVYELHHEGKKTASKSTQSNVGEDSSNAEGAEFEKESLHDLIDLFQGKSLEDFSESDPADEPVSLPNQLDFEKYDGNIVVSEEVAPEELENEARYLNSQALKDVEEETEAPESGEKIMSPICIKK
ncbi:MAG TPA: hypothetical protein VJC18_00735, partial [bacterium]|nr:hypothetical protein [bacterium]